MASKSPISGAVWLVQRVETLDEMQHRQETVSDHGRLIGTRRRGSEAVLHR